MSYHIVEDAALIEVHISGETTKWEILEILSKLRKMDPLKERCDLWQFSSESMLPYDVFPSIAATAKSFCTPDLVGKPSALVTDDRMLSATLDMYSQEAAVLPYPIRVFNDRDSALEWLKN